MLEKRFNTPLDVQCGPPLRCRGRPGRCARSRELMKARRRWNWNGWRPTCRRIETYPLEFEPPRHGTADAHPDRRYPAAHPGGRRRRAPGSRRLRDGPAFSFDAGRDHRRRLSRLRQTTGIGAVVLSGGVFMNALLTREAMQRLARRRLPRLSSSSGAAQRRRPEPGPAGHRRGRLATLAT